MAFVNSLICAFLDIPGPPYLLLVPDPSEAIAERLVHRIDLPFTAIVQN